MEPAGKFRRVSRPMGELVDLADKEAVHAALDREVRTLYTVDRDLRRFPFLKVRDPLEP